MIAPFNHARVQVIEVIRTRSARNGELPVASRSLITDN